MFDGKVPHWYHFSCFWKVGHSIRQPDTEVDGFSELRWDDQQKVKKTAEAGGVAGVYIQGSRASLLRDACCFAFPDGKGSLRLCMVLIFNRF